jgi:hypothetical protein
MRGVKPRRKLGTRGRAWAAGLSIGAAAALGIAMAATDHSASAAPVPNGNPGVVNQPSIGSGDGGNGFQGDPFSGRDNQQQAQQPSSQQAPQVHTRTGGS